VGGPRVDGRAGGADRRGVHPQRSLQSLRWLGLALGLATAGGALAVELVTPDAAWEQALVQTAIMLGAAAFVPWSWRWQLALCGAVVAAAGAAAAVIVPTHLGRSDAARESTMRVDRDLKPAVENPFPTIVGATIGPTASIGEVITENKTGAVAFATAPVSVFSRQTTGL